MKQLVAFRTGDGEQILVEVDDRGDVAGVERAGRGGEVVIKAGVTFEEAMAPLKSVASAVMRALRDLSDPDEVGIEFGVKLGTNAGVILASASAEANIGVKLTWKKQAKTGEGHATSADALAGEGLRGGR